MHDKKEYARKYYLRTREIQIQKARDWQSKNSLHVLEYKRKRYWSDPDKFRKIASDYSSKNRLKINIRNRKSSGDCSMKRRLNWIDERCNNINHRSYSRYGGRGIKNLLTIDDLRSIWNRDDAGKMDKPSIDRIDNNGNYTLENCRFIEISENVKRQHEEDYLTEELSNEIINKFKSSCLSARKISTTLGVSKFVISRAMYRGYGISKETYEKIKDKMEVLDGIKD